jgi:HAD superfamily hydrolase (TIGR01509 family)
VRTAARLGPDSEPVLEAVLFDMDGTIVDTEPYWIAAEYELVSRYGGTWSDEHAHALVGNALLTSAEYLQEHGGVRMPAPAIVEWLLDRVIAASERSVPWRPGAVDLLRELGELGVRCALVTMSYARLATVVAAHLPEHTFATVVTGDQVQDGKPHPEAYLTAVERLGVDATRCVAIEDSPTGIASAEGAGCVVVAVPHHVTITPADGRTIVSSLAELTVADLDALVRRSITLD